MMMLSHRDRMLMGGQLDAPQVQPDPRPPQVTIEPAANTDGRVRKIGLSIAETIADGIAASVPGFADESYPGNAEDYGISVRHMEDSIAYHNAHARDHIERAIKAQDRLVKVKKMGEQMQPPKEAQR